jgi:predicted neutral ceramidase superfamily lipid hydrolase
MADDSGSTRGETRKERIDRELIELLNELRVALPGVQVLFAFLLTVPFSQRFAAASDLQRNLYFVALVTAAIASGLLIAPAAQHRILFRKQEKDQLLRRANRYAIYGVTMLVVAMTSAILLVVDFLFGLDQALPAALVVAAILTWLWVVEPLIQRRKGVEDPLDR